MKKTVLIMLMLLFLGLPVMAGTDYNVCFTKLDSDYDGEMTRAEFDSAFTGADATVFETADGDKNGTVSHDEWEEYKASQGFEEGEEHG